MGLVGCLAVLWLKRLRYPWSRLRRRIGEGRHLSTELPPANSLQEVQQCLRQITWTGDGLLHLYDAISYPQTVWHDKRDDCDGFAVLAAELIRRFDPSLNPVLVTAAVRPLPKSHTVCAFKDGDKLAFFDNRRLRRGNYRSYKNIVDWFTRHAEKAICWDVVDHITLTALEFHRV
jgi:hypothetical protein